MAGSKTCSKPGPHSASDQSCEEDDVVLRTEVSFTDPAALTAVLTDSLEGSLRWRGLGQGIMIWFALFLSVALDRTIITVPERCFLYFCECVGEKWVEQRSPVAPRTVS